MRNRMMILISGAIAALLTTQLFAAEIKWDNEGCFSGPAHIIQHADGSLVGSGEVANLRLTDKYGNPPWSGHCVGTFKIIGGQFEENGACEFADPAGDKFLGLFARK